MTTTTMTATLATVPHHEGDTLTAQESELLTLPHHRALHVGGKPSGGSSGGSRTGQEWWPMQTHAETAGATAGTYLCDGRYTPGWVLDGPVIAPGDQASRQAAKTRICAAVRHERAGMSRP
jgi:hypothetical protein